MVELIIEETGFPKDRPTLKEFQDSSRIPINELLSRLPGNRILSGFVSTHGGGGAISYTEGILLYKGKLWTVKAYNGTLLEAGYISFFEETISLNFNVGTQANPIYDMRPGKIQRTARVGTHAGRAHIAITSQFLRGRKALEYLKAGSIFVGLVVVDIETAIYHINFRENIGTKDYQVLGNFRAADVHASFNRAFTWDVNNRTNYGFDVYIDQATANSIPLIFDYTVIPINRTNTFDEG